MANNGQGADLWLAPIYKTHDSDSFDFQGLYYDVALNLYGVALSADFEFMLYLTAGLSNVDEFGVNANARFVSMHHMPLTIPVEHSCALAPLHSQRLITSASFFPHYPLSYIPYFPHPICYHHNHKYLRHTQSTPAKPRFTTRARAHPAQLSQLARLTPMSSSDLIPLDALSHLPLPSTYLTYGLIPIPFTSVKILQNNARPQGHFSAIKTARTIYFCAQYSNTKTLI